MPYETNRDMPQNLRAGLSTEQQNIVRGLVNALVYDSGMGQAEAEQIAVQTLTSAGMTYQDRKWNGMSKAVGIITKVDEDKRLVFGWASIIKDEGGKILLDRQDDFIDSEEELEKAAYTYVLHSRDGGEMHVRKGVSTMVESVVFSKEKQAALGIPEGVVPIGWWIGFRVNDDRVWEQVKKGEYSGFSVHGTGKRDKSILMPGEYTEVEKHTVSKEHVMPESDLIPVSKNLFDLLTKAQKAKKNKIATVMREFKAGKLKSSSGEVVTNPRQAMAIALSEQQRMSKDDVAKHGSHDQSTHGRRSGVTIATGIAAKPARGATKPKAKAPSKGGASGGKPKVDYSDEAWDKFNKSKPIDPIKPGERKRTTYRGFNSDGDEAIITRSVAGVQPGSLSRGQTIVVANAAKGYRPFQAVVRGKNRDGSVNADVGSASAGWTGRVRAEDIIGLVET